MEVASARCPWRRKLKQPGETRLLSASVPGTGPPMVDQADELYAVWDGKPARSFGGTADVVAYAREHGTPVRVIWPDGAHRD
jgi:hypothetical protein